MKLNKSKFRVYIDITIFIVLSMLCCIDMLISIITNNPMVKHSLVFIYVYLLNLLFYRMCIEIKETKFINTVSFDLLMSALCILCLISTLMHVVYLVYFAIRELNGLGLIAILSNHVTYATIVGSWFVMYLAFDNMNTFNNLYINK